MGFLVDGRDLHCIKVPNNNNHWYGLVVSAVLATEVQSAYCNRYWMNLKARGGYMVRWGGGGAGIVRFLGCCFEKNAHVESFEAGENV